MSPTFEGHHHDHDCKPEDRHEHKLDEIIHLLNKLNRKFERFSHQDFSREDKQVKDAHARIPPATTTNQKKRKTP